MILQATHGKVILINCFIWAASFSLTMPILFYQVGAHTQTAEPETGEPARLPAQVAGRWRLSEKVCSEENNTFVCGLTRAPKARQTSIVLARRAQRTNQERTVFTCTPRVSICLNFNNKQGPPLSGLSDWNWGRTYGEHVKGALAWLVRWAPHAGTRDLFCLGCSSRPRTKCFFSSPYTVSLNLYPSSSKLGRQSCWVACLLISVSWCTPYHETRKSYELHGRWKRLHPPTAARWQRWSLYLIHTHTEKKDYKREKGGS